MCTLKGARVCPATQSSYTVAAHHRVLCLHHSYPLSVLLRAAVPFFIRIGDMQELWKTGHKMDRISYFLGWFYSHVGSWFIPLAVVAVAIGGVHYGPGYDLTYDKCPDLAVGPPRSCAHEGC